MNTLKRFADRLVALVNDDRTISFVLTGGIALWILAAAASLAQAITWSEAKKWLTGAAFYVALGILLRIAWFVGNVYRARAAKQEAETAAHFTTKN